MILRKKIIALLLMLACILALISCDNESTVPPESNPPSDGVTTEPPESNPPQDEVTIVEYGYEKDDDFAKVTYVNYKIAYKIPSFIEYEEGTLPKVTIKYSHGANGPWIDGGYVYPDVTSVELHLVGDGLRILSKNAYFNYLEAFYYVDYATLPIFPTTPPLHGDEVYKEYTSSYSNENTDYISYSNESEYEISLKEGVTQYTLAIREILVYREESRVGGRYVVKASFYVKFGDGIVYFSNEPFDEAE